MATGFVELRGIRTGLEEIKDLKKSIEELRNAVDGVQNFADDMIKMRKEIADIKKDFAASKTAPTRMIPNQLTEDDLYGLEDEYIEDEFGGLNVGNAGTNLPTIGTGLYPNIGRVPPVYGPNLYPLLHYPGLGLHQPGELSPFLVFTSSV